MPIIVKVITISVTVRKTTYQTRCFKVDISEMQANNLVEKN